MQDDAVSLEEVGGGGARYLQVDPKYPDISVEDIELMNKDQPLSPNSNAHGNYLKQRWQKLSFMLQVVTSFQNTSISIDTVTRRSMSDPEIASLIRDEDTVNVPNISDIGNSTSISLT